ncbi:helix-turn-helix transcriptional regulator [Streptomyces sp. MRC013]|uniref:helix-turn-helix domain-containing protein n=1 Tax=Streptomyces sp. MRC013 TaxID=2898276 RepID=UPI0020268240|nr:helix-turn-helix transcriptional regulator [Streptomyces sp. MRC013]URM90484.1 helix-turn-helix transcriptional regulator [Streptomyces sp. MRC013]
MAGRENKEKATPTAQLVAHMTRTLRKQKGLTQEQLGEMCGFSGGAISGVETCAQPASDQMLVKPEAAIGDGMGFFEEARLYLRIEKYPVQFKEYALLERAAVNLYLFATPVVHGLFQTEEYARALIAGGFPILTEERVEELVDARIARREVFDREPPTLVELVLDEAVLLRPIGDRGVMHRQLEFLLECARRRNVTIQVLPLDCALHGEYAGARGELNVLETQEHEHLVYLEIQDESLLVSDPAKVSTCMQRYARIRGQALTARESLGLIERLAGEQQ